MDPDLAENQFFDEVRTYLNQHRRGVWGAEPLTWIQWTKKLNTFTGGSPAPPDRTAQNRLFFEGRGGDTPPGNFSDNRGGRTFPKNL